MFDKMVLGKNQVFSCDSRETQINSNLIVVGPTGAGKTMSVTEPSLLYSEGSQVCTLTKRALVRQYSEYFKRRDYHVLDVDFAHPDKSEYGYNPLNFVYSFEDIQALAYFIVMADPNKKDNKKADPFWDLSAEYLLEALIAYSMAVEKHPTMKHVMDLFNSLKIEESSGAIKTSLDDQFDTIRQMDSKHFAVIKFDYFCSNPYRTAACIYTTLAAALSSMFTPAICEMSRNRKQLDLRLLTEERGVLFLTTSAMNPVSNVIVALFYSQLFDELLKIAEESPYERLPVSVRITCDDIATGAPIPELAQKISIFRAAGISISMNVQSESQLEAMYSKEDATTIINNCDSYLYMGGTDIATAERIGKRLDLPIFDVLSLPLEKVCVFRRGQKPVITKRYETLDDVRYKEMLEYTKIVRDRGDEEVNVKKRKQDNKEKEIA